MQAQAQNKQKDRAKAGYALVWVASALVIILVLTVGLLSVSQSFAERSINEYAESQSYLTARAACDAVAEYLLSLDETELDQVLPEKGRQLAVNNFQVSDDLADLSQVTASISNSADGKLITVAATAQVGDRSDTVNRLLNLGSTTTTTDPTIIGQPSEEGFSGLTMSNSLEVRNDNLDWFGIIPRRGSPCSIIIKNAFIYANDLMLYGRDATVLVAGSPGTVYTSDGYISLCGYRINPNGGGLINWLADILNTLEAKFGRAPAPAAPIINTDNIDPNSLAHPVNVNSTTKELLPNIMYVSNGNQTGVELVLKDNENDPSANSYYLQVNENQSITLDNITYSGDQAYVQLYIELPATSQKQSTELIINKMAILEGANPKVRLYINGGTNSYIQTAKNVIMSGAIYGYEMYCDTSFTLNYIQPGSYAVIPGDSYTTITLTDGGYVL